MTEHEQEHQVAPMEMIAGTNGESGLEGNASLLDLLRKQRVELATTRDTFIPVSGYGEKTGIALYAHYVLVGDEVTDDIRQRISQEFPTRRQTRERLLWSAIDVMIASCDGIYYQIGNDERKPLADDDGPVTGYDLSLARALGFENEVHPQRIGRTVVLGVFGNNTAAIQVHALMLGRWMGDTSLDVTSEFLEAGGNL